MNAEDLDSEDYTTKFSDYFTFKSLVGKGAFACVVSAISKADDQEYAVKIIKKQNLSQSNWQRVKQESRLLASLNHDNIVRFKETIETDKRLLLVMELIKGGDLRQFIEMRQKNKKAITDEEASIIMRSILSAVQYLHSKEIVHRDLKPENILIHDWNKLDSIKIADFGLSAQFSGDFSTQNFRQKVGTVIYMAPEQASEKIYSKPVDIWSCGLIMYILLANGKHPLYERNDNNKTFFAKVRNPKWNFGDFFTPLAKSFFLKMMNVDPVIRYTADDALKHPWLTRRFDDPIPLSGHEVMSCYSLEQTFMRMVKAMYMMNNIGTYTGDKTGFEDYADLVDEVSKEGLETQGKKEVVTTNNIFDQYDNLQSLLGLASPKQQTPSKPEIKWSQIKRPEARENSAGPTVKRVFLEESKLLERLDEVEEQESPLNKRYISKPKKILGTEGNWDISFGDKNESELKASTIRLVTASELSKERLEGVKAMIGAAKHSTTETRNLTLSTDYASAEVVKNMRTFMNVGGYKSPKASQKPASMLQRSYDEKEREMESLIMANKSQSEKKDKIRAPSAQHALNTKNFQAPTNFSSNASDESSDGSTDGRVPESKEKGRQLVKKSPFFHNSTKKIDISSLNPQPAKEKNFVIRTPSSRLYSAKPNSKGPLPRVAITTPKAGQKNEEEALSARLNTGDTSNKPRIRFTSQTPQASHSKGRNIIAFPDAAKAATLKTLTSTTTKSTKSIQDVSSLTSFSMREVSSLTRKTGVRSIRDNNNNTITSINFL